MLFNLQFLKFWFKASNSKGHGTHSPFVYDFIMNVLNDDRVFYCFKELEQARKKYADNELCNAKKVDELLFRMVDYYQLKNVVAINSNAITQLYLNNTNAAISNELQREQKDLIFIDTAISQDLSIDEIIEACKPKSFIIINKNNTHQHQQKLWQHLVADKRIDTTIDLYHLGIAVINPDFKVKQHFNIRY
ncbi:MAG: hypothetical protein NTZ59_09895 [Bacteroidetes bacterium]|jgi:hypothetical protein|nr:hypothetical protein [Bacteroidota bacterium]